MQLSLAQFLEVIEDESVLIIDARPIASIMEGYIPNSIHITPATAKYAIAMDIIRKDSSIVFIVEEAIAAETLAYFTKAEFTGMNISSEEIEGLLAACPGVQEVAVVGVPDRILGEKLCACVVSAPGQRVSLDDLVQFLRGQQRVAAYKLPEYLLQVDALPRNPVGKILKRELREQARALAPETV